MAITIQIDNFSSNNIREQSQLAVAVVAGATSVTPDNIQGYATGDFLLIGRPGAEQTEKRTATVSGNSITVAALAYDHKRFAQITSIWGDQAKLYRAANTDGKAPANASFAVVGSAVTIETDQNFTNLVDNGVTPDTAKNYWYKYTFYNSSTTTETDLGDSVAIRGGGYGHYAAISLIRKAAGFANNMNITPSTIDEYRVQAEDEVNSALVGQYVLPFDPVPPKITEIVKQLAAGHLLIDQFGAFTAGAGGKSGKDMVDEARAELLKYQKRQLTLVDATASSQLSTAGTGVTSWPNATTADAALEDGGSDRRFRAGMQF